MSSSVFDPNKTPILAPPDGVIPNFENPESRAYIPRSVTYAFLPLIPLFLALRFCSRAIITRNIGIDDVLCALGAASIITTCGMLLSLLDRPNGRHLWDVPMSILTDTYLKTNFTFVIISSASLMFVKLSLPALYLRIFNPVWAAKVTIYVCLGLVFLFYIATIIAELVVGIPGRGDKGWAESQMEYGPFGLGVSVVRGVFGVVSDFVILLIPMTQIIGLQGLPTKKKMILIFIFLTGLLACVSSLLSCVFRFEELGDPDYTWANVIANSFATIELIVGFVCSCLPTIPPLLLALGKNPIVASIVGYLRSSRHSKNDGDPVPNVRSEDTREQLPSIPRAHLTGLRSFIRGGGLFSFSRKSANVNTTEGSAHYNLESIDIDYHTQLKQVNQDSESTTGLRHIQHDHV